MLQLTDVFHTKLICLWSLLNWRKKSWPEKLKRKELSLSTLLRISFHQKLNTYPFVFANVSPIFLHCLPKCYWQCCYPTREVKLTLGLFGSFEKIIMLSITFLCALLLQNFTTISLSRVNVFTVSFNFEICEISEMQLPNPIVFKFMS